MLEKVGRAGRAGTEDRLGLAGQEDTKRVLLMPTQPTPRGRGSAFGDDVEAATTGCIDRAIVECARVTFWNVDFDVYRIDNFQRRLVRVLAKAGCSEAG